MPNDDDYTNYVPDVYKMHNIVKNMHSNASLGLDGLNAGFNKSVWPWIAQDIHKLVTEFYSSTYFPQELNHTFVALIPRKFNLCCPRILDLLVCVMSSIKS